MDSSRAATHQLSKLGRQVILRLDDGSLVADQSKFYSDSVSKAVHITLEQALKLGRVNEADVKRLQSLVTLASQRISPKKGNKVVNQAGHDILVPLKKQRIDSAPSVSISSGGAISQHNWVDKCRDILELMKGHLGSNKTLFYEPPDTKSFPMYTKLVKKSMWLKRIEETLNGNRYQTAQDFYQDMKLVWANCEKFNGRLTPIGLVGVNADSFLDQCWASSGLADDGHRSKRAKAGVAAPKYDPDVFDSHAKPKASAKSQRSGKKSTVPDRCHEVTSAQRDVKRVSDVRVTEIAAELSNLQDPDALQGAMNLVPQQFLVSDEAGEVELDFESLDQETLYKLDQYLRSLAAQHQQQQPSRVVVTANKSSSSSSEESDSDYD